MNINYPFTAIVGQEKLKKVLILNLINERIGGVLIDGERGSAKSTAVRSLVNLTNKRIVNMPINISEDKLIGSIDIEKTLINANPEFEKGLLYKANKNILYVDEVNLLPDNIVDILLDVSASKSNIVEREGISYIHESDFIIIGTMNRENGEIRSEFLDRFPLYVYVESCKEAQERVEILKRVQRFESNRKEFIDTYLQEEKEIFNHIENAKQLVDSVQISQDIYYEIAKLSIEKNISGHRADIIMVETIKALAAFDFRKEAIINDVYEAAAFVYPHRTIMSKENKEENKEENKNQEENQKDNKQDSENDDNKNTEGKSENRNSSKNEGSDRNSRKSKVTKEINEIFNVGETYSVCSFAHKKDKEYRKTQGKRSKTKAKNKTGQYLYYTSRISENDIAFDATIRAAAPFQRYRKKNGMAIALRKGDLKWKIRQGKVSNLIVIVVDSSGSIGANKRMIEVKGAVLSLLKDSYVRRDKVALVAFRGEKSEVLLPPTNNVERAYKLLDEMQTGGRSPLNAGIIKGYEIIKSQLRKDKSIMPMLIIISDCKGNVSLDASLKPNEELKEIAEAIRKDTVINTIVIDVEKKGVMSFGKAKILSENIGATYVCLENLRRDDILSTINREIEKYE